ncbi:CDP-alcohol phosphatidyltransferase family protein [Acidobacteria bacterium AH-259-O06]|nr:CDP-alcohol phosphatidyltransferase family protein [Acidobacteria bacterium AH-259-O06]
MAAYSLSQIKQAHAQKKEYDRQFPLSYFLVRPASFYFSYLILKITESPSRIAYVGLVIGLAGSFFLVLLPEFTVWPGLLLLIIYDLLDASDGNIARVTGNVTRYGKFLDGVVGEIVEGLCWFGLGLGLYRSSGDFPLLQYVGLNEDSVGFVLLLAGLTITVATLYSGQVMSSYYTHYSEHQKGQNVQSTLTEPVKTSKYRRRWSYLLFVNVSSFDFQLLMFLLCSVFTLLDFFLILYAVFYLCQWIVFTTFYLYRARRTLS